MKILLKTFSILIMVVAGGIFLWITLKSEKLPIEIVGKNAEEVAAKMLLSINDKAWQKTEALSWEYRGHKFIWDKKRHFAQVIFDDKEVLIDINARKGIIVKGGVGLSKSDKASICNEAWEMWVNDSFWLNPISKCKDPGTTRAMVSLTDGREALMISYKSGGVTPGDTYAWILDDNFRPIAWKLWVSIIPIKGKELSWEDWVQLKTGVWISTKHVGLITLNLSNPNGFYTLNEMTNGVDIFESLSTAEINF